MSETANVKYGGTKKKSKAATLRTDASIDGPRPCAPPTSTTPSRYTMTRFASSKWRNISHATPCRRADDRRGQDVARPVDATARAAGRRRWAPRARRVMT